MKKWHFLVVAAFLLHCSSASADNWRDENPNQPNGYAASTFRYHHGTPGGDDGPANGYRASSFRSSHGLEGYMPPDKESSGRWGGGGESERWGESGRFGGSGGGGLGRHFRQGQQEGAEMRRQMLQNRFASGGQMGMGRFGGMQSTGYGGQSRYGGAQYSGTATGAVYGGQSYHSGMRPGYGQMGMNQGGYFQGAPSGYGSYNSNYPESLHNALEQRPIGQLLRNSRSGFNRIYN